VIMESEPEPAPVEPPTTDELLAAAVSDPERLAQLLDNVSANIDALDDRGYAALHLAVWQGNLAAVETLLEYGADVEATTRTKKRPLYLAVEAGNTEIVAALLVHGAVPDADVQGLTALHEAVRRGEVEAARLLLDYGADVNATTYDLREPLFLAVLSRKANVIKLLLDRGAEPDSFFTEDPPTALHLAAHYGDVDAMEALLDRGANVDPRDFEGGTPLFRAVESGHLNAVELLLQRGANTRAWRVDGRTALDLAEGNDDMRELLEAETVWKGPRIGGDDSEDADEQPEQPFSVLKPSPPPPETDRHKNVACHGFEAIVVDFYTSGTEEEMVPKTPSVYELLYSQGPEAFRSTLQGRTPDFTWYHLPANNVCPCHATTAIPPLE
jgi:ankyrin repeat protein